ncbi:MAG: sigma-54-dependent Fis family transcriptional regulator, partial [Planctomycetes bacterium]|nr:sigma-54-dependent Fis family transcriptional regulator [Planctomycetota bacterium]
ILTKSASITIDDLPDEVRLPQAAGAGGNGRILPLKRALEGPEKEIILRALRTFQGSRQATSEALGIDRTTLYKKMKRYGIEDDGE